MLLDRPGMTCPAISLPNPSRGPVGLSGTRMVSLPPRPKNPGNMAGGRFAGNLTVAKSLAATCHAISAPGSPIPQRLPAI